MTILNAVFLALSLIIAGFIAWVVFWPHGEGDEGMIGLAMIAYIATAVIAAIGVLAPLANLIYFILR